MDTGIDFAGNHPGAINIKNAGYKFVARYLSRYTAKTITLSEYQDDVNNGVNVVLVFEDYANQALNGYNQGVADAKVALAQADALGWPSDRPLYFAVDFDINDAQKIVAGEYMKGVASVLGLPRTGGYGGYWWVKYCFDNGLITYGWQAVAWSGGNREARAHIFQQLGGTVVNGTSCDIDQALQADYGQNNVTGANTMTDENYVRAFFIDLFATAPTPEQIAQYVNRPWMEVYNELRSAPPHQQLLDYYHAVVSEDAARLVTINQLNAQIAELEKQPNTSDQVKALQAQVDALTSKNKALQDQITQANKTGNAFITWIGNFFNRSKK